MKYSLPFSCHTGKFPESALTPPQMLDFMYEKVMNNRWQVKN
jgi:hypothetical protein